MTAFWAFSPSGAFCAAGRIFPGSGACRPAQQRDGARSALPCIKEDLIMDIHADTHSPLHDCITQCWTCRTECQKVFFSHCLEAGGKHLEAEHVKILMDCIAICQVAADSMVRGSPVHAALCAA